ncbi:hypothetical protein GGH96_002124 [Coemansia sp. RSA 1972]|nr:hypothetical protein GGH96_002124 [Coemansia sp. RSA 1972]
MLPKITEKFQALTLMTWIISSYVVASTALQPIYGKLCHIYGHQYVLLVAHAFFLAGSVVCGASKSAHMLIAGRTIAGVGGSGLLSICFVVVGDFIPTARSPLYLSVFGMMWAIASVVGPLLGGVFADKTGFEWGFYINPCIQGIVIVLIVLFMRIPRPQGSATSKLKRIDFIGIFAIVAGIVLLELALTWGGQDHPWKSAAVIVPLILGILILGVFVLIEWKIAKEPVMPLRLFKRRNTRLMFVAQIFFGMSFFMPIFYFPLYLSNSVDQQDIATTTTLFMTIRMLGNAIGLAIAQSVLQNEISPLLKVIAAQFPDQANVVFGIVSDQSVIWKTGVPEDVRSSVIDAYVKSLQKVYLVFLAFGGLTFIVSLFAKNLKLRKNLGGAAAE